MRRRDRELTELSDMISVLDQCKVVRVGMHDGKKIYVLPLNFGYTFEGEKLVLYLHCGKEGKKLDLLRENPYVFIEMDCEHQLIEGRKPCQYGYLYASIMGEGTAEIIDDPKEKIKGMEILMKCMTGKEFPFDERLVSIVNVIKITVDEYTGKRRPMTFAEMNREHIPHAMETKACGADEIDKPAE